MCFDYRHPNGYEGVSHCVFFVCISLMADNIEHLFMYLWPFECLLCRDIYLDSLSIYKLDGLFIGVLYIFYYMSHQLYYLEIFSPIL